MTQIKVLFSRALILILATAFFEAPPAFGMNPPQELAPILLAQGEQRVLRFPGLSKFSLGNDLVRILPLTSHGQSNSGESLLIKAIQVGSTDLWVWKKDGSVQHRSIQVEKAPTSDKIPAHLIRALSRLEEVEIIRSGQGFILRGTISTFPEAARVAALTRNQSHPQNEPSDSSIIDETDISETLLNEAHKNLTRWLENSSLKNLWVEMPAHQSGIWLRGHVKDSRQLASLEKKIRSIFPMTQLDLQSMPDHSPTIHFRVFLLELKKTRLMSLGLGWPAMQANALQITSWGLKEALRLDVAIQALEDEGNAKILSNPELVVRAPGEAELFAGGELPIKTSTPYNSQVSWRTYGLTLKLKVTHVAGNRVRLDIFTEVSHLDATIASGSIPGLQANRMKTQVDATFGSPLLLSGLLQQGTREQARGLPFLRQIPVLGLLFGSQDYLMDRSELVAVLLPQASPPTPPIARFSRFLPRGPVPAPRNWIAPSEERAMRDSKNFPWNSLE